MPVKHKFVETKLFLAPVGLLHLTFYEISQSWGNKENKNQLLKGTLTSDSWESPGTPDIPEKA